MKKNILFIFVIALLSNPMFSQNTVGLLSYVPAKSFDGYNLVYPHNQPNVYLLDNCGEVVHMWTDDTDFRPGNMAYLLEDGRLVKTKRPSAVAGNPIWAGGGGATIEIRDWDNNLEWSYTLNNDSLRLHHDIAVVEKNNTLTILAIAWELKTEAEALQAGRDTSTTAQDKLWPDYIFEIDPATDDIIWEWHAWDHLVQDFDNTKSNFGVVADHPEKININYETSMGHPDWMHSNAIDYEPITDQIILSVPTFSELWIIDHTTTTAEAASSSGGFSGRGGDLMYRWGNPLTYGGDTTDQRLFYQHDTHWVDDYLDSSHPYYGKLAMFNNRIGDDFSTANIVTPPWDMYTWSYTMNGNKWGPTDPDVTFSHPIPQEMYSTGLSSIQMLPNGNVLLCSGRWGYVFEMTPDSDIVWEYIMPRIGPNPATQGDTLSINNNLTFRMNRIPLDYPAFAGKDLTPQGYLELQPNETFCFDILNDLEIINRYGLKIYPNPANDLLVIEWEKGGKSVDFEIFDILGRRLENMTATGGRKYLDISDWKEGVYFVRINGMDIQKIIVRR